MRYLNRLNYFYLQTNNKTEEIISYCVLKLLIIDIVPPAADLRGEGGGGGDGLAAGEAQGVQVHWNILLIFDMQYVKI